MSLKFSINRVQIDCKIHCKTVKYASYLYDKFFIHRENSKGKVLILLENDYLCNIE